MTPDPAPDPMELLDLLQCEAHDHLCPGGFEDGRNRPCKCWKTELPALRAAIEAMRAELAEWRTLHALVRPDTPAEKGSP
jgi:hypothetical protein